jgi:SAM-dependent methyltransferase
MAVYNPNEIKDAVRAHYGSRAEGVLTKGEDAGCCGPAGAGGLATALYGKEAVADLPETVVSYGCGNPTAIAGLRAGETVLDLGSGAGLDCFLAARQVGPAGRAIGLDMTESMLQLARTNQAKLGLENVEFRQGEMEAMPLDDASVDVIISNCVINLSPDKDAVFREAFRVLRPGGRLHVSDVVLTRPLTSAEQGDLDTWAGCVSGALLVDDYRARLEAAGFVEVSVQPTERSERPWGSALVTAYKRAADGGIVRANRSTAIPTLQTMIPLEVVSEGGACCGPSATSCC